MLDLAELNLDLQLIRAVQLNETFVFSPLSLIFGIALLHAGAGGSTRSHIVEVAKRQGAEKQFVSYYSDLRRTVDMSFDLFAEDMAAQESLPTLLHFINTLYVQYKATYPKTFQDRLKIDYSFTAENGNFSKPASLSQHANAEVGKVTKKQGYTKESDFVDAEALLINSAHFHDEWLAKFDELRTQEAKFWTTKDTWKNVTFITDGTAQRQYFLGEDFEVIGNLFRDMQYAFVILLPRKRYELHEALKNLTPARLSTLLTAPRWEKLKIMMPRINVETRLDTRRALDALGLGDLLSARANLTGIAGGHLKLAGVIHKVFLELDEVGINEKGLTGASASFVEDPAVKVVVADHPFLFLVTKDGHPVFAGIYQ